MAVNNNMRSTKNIFTLRLINALVFAILIFIQYNGVFSLKIANANPMLPIALLVMVAMFCSEISACVAGLIVGLFMDSVAATPGAFNSVVLFLLGLGVALVVRHLFNNNIWSAIVLCAVSTAIYFLLRWAFCIAFSITFAENLTYLLRNVFPSVLYTAVFAIPFYYFEKNLYKKLYY